MIHIIHNIYMWLHPLVSVVFCACQNNTQRSVTTHVYDHFDLRHPCNECQLKCVEMRVSIEEARPMNFPFIRSTGSGKKERLDNKDYKVKWLHCIWSAGPLYSDLPGTLDDQQSSIRWLILECWSSRALGKSLQLTCALKRLTIIN